MSVRTSLIRPDALPSPSANVILLQQVLCLDCGPQVLLSSQLKATLLPCQT